ncbi:2'-5' RNA ligase family protein [Thauera mechernichensis]|uniref:2'-5' RNA ligase family protein n=1 Tax=Thauera mechernichensis TaxID=82788 RepID=A0ABW3WE79_9RHOO|nr:MULTISPECIES: 2'-5' RNA ligase family protein [Thauera]ENO80655.1 hypothetical protein B447_11957 [Thauera sp. 27]MDG3065760.1 2'-5' RNA ligase family protein [Thauera mechernichensis]
MITPAALRQRFLAEPLTLRNERRDFGDWHRGRPHYLLWAIDVDLPAVRSRITAAQRALDGLLLDGYRRQPHITLALCGFPARTARPAVDEFDRHWLQARIDALAAARITPFTVAIGALESFSSAPFLHVDGADGPLGALRACLHADTPHPQGEYVPHVTVGLYADAYPTHSVAQRFDVCAPVVPLRCTIERISLMGYVAAEIGGALFTLAEWDLAAHRLQWRSRLAAAELFRCREPVRANRDTAPASDLPMEMP